MNISELLKAYSDAPDTKSGFLMTSGKCVYLYNNFCCEAVSKLVFMRSSKTEILSDKCGEFFVCRYGAKILAYKDFRRITGLNELVILYEIPSENDGGLCGVFAYEKDKRLIDAHYTDARISELINSLITGESQRAAIVGKQMKQLEQAVRSGEVTELNKIYINGKRISDGGIL